MNNLTRFPWMMLAAFLLLILSLNANLFTRAYVEYGDSAANSLLVQQAKHFTLLTGHYSRWRFHHPGPAYFYIFALGEFVFYKLLHLVPTPYNGQVLITIVMNVALLGAVLSIFRRYVEFSVPLALAITTVVVMMLNSMSLSSALVSNWMPDVLLFPYLLLAASAASVLSNNTRDLPFLSLSGMLLIHAHVAQLLFVALIGGGSVAVLIGRAVQQKRLPILLKENRVHFLVAAAICFVFSLPPLLDFLLHHPNNLDDIRAYLRHNEGQRNTVVTSARYMLSFLLFVGRPEAIFSSPAGSVLLTGLSRPLTVGYLVGFCGVLTLTLVDLSKRGRPPVAPFLKYFCLIGAATVLIFFFWARRITGELFDFNGRFFGAVHLIAWFAMLALLSRHLLRGSGRVVALTYCGFTLVFAIMDGNILRHSWSSIPDSAAVASIVPSEPKGRLAIVFDQDDWPWAVGVANSMVRRGKEFCVTDDWGFMFTRENVCPAGLNAIRSAELAVVHNGLKCESPCRVLFRGGDLSAGLTPSSPSALPLIVGLRSSPAALTTGFDDEESGQRWTTKHASIQVFLPPDLPNGDCLHLELTGFAYPGRAAHLFFNGRELGTMVNEASATVDFAVPREAVRAGDVNEISIDTPKAGPVGRDVREIGFGFVNLALRGAKPAETCPFNSSQLPAYSSVPVEWRSGCYGVEQGPGQRWRWCGAASSLVLRNKSSKVLRVVLHANVSTAHADPSRLAIQSEFFRDIISVNSSPREYRATVLLPPGEHIITFKSNAPKAVAPGDPRAMVLRFDRLDAQSRDIDTVTDRANSSQAGPLVVWASGYYDREAAGENEWRWAGPRSEFILVNDTNAPIPIALRATLFTGQKEPSAVHLRSVILSKSYTVNADGVDIAEQFILPKGKFVFELSTDAPRLIALGDPRVLVLQLRNFHIERSDESR